MFASELHAYFILSGKLAIQNFIDKGSISVSERLCKQVNESSGYCVVTSTYEGGSMYCILYVAFQN